MAFTQPATFNEPWSDERVLSHFNKQPPTGENADFFSLYHGYKHMRPDDFERLLKLYIDHKRDINAQNSQGQTLAEVITPHAHQAAPFLKLLVKYSC